MIDQYITDTNTEETLIDEDRVSLATNHAGWNVQEFTVSGWRTLNAPPFTTRREAVRTLSGLIGKFPEKEFRVYEALHLLAA